MRPDDYQSTALTKMADQNNVRQRVYELGPTATQLDNGARGIAEEAGEVQAVVKRYLEYGRGLDRERLLDECGDVLWRVCQTLDAAGWTLEQAMQANLKKLGIRFKQGFTEQEAADENRDRAVEAAVQATEAPFGRDYLGNVRQVPHENDVNNRGKTTNGSCRYCGKNATCTVVWFRGPPGKPGPVKVPYCGKCSLKDALAKRGMTAPVKEYEDYIIERQATVEQDGHGFGHVTDKE